MKPSDFSLWLEDEVLKIFEEYKKTAGTRKIYLDISICEMEGQVMITANNRYWSSDRDMPVNLILQEERK